jgi:hypothetical protein
MFDELRGSEKTEGNSSSTAGGVATGLIGASGLLFGLPYAFMLLIATQAAQSIGQMVFIFAAAGFVAFLSLAAMVYALLRW